MCLLGVLGGQKRVLDPLGLELQVAVSYHGGAGELNPGPLEEEPVLLTPEPSPQPCHSRFLKEHLVCYIFSRGVLRFCLSLCPVTLTPQDLLSRLDFPSPDLVFNHSSAEQPDSPVRT